MGVTTTKTNKPFNPRGNDQSPKGYNRAALYSGKALDFDGVNDGVALGAVSGTLSNLSMSWYVKTTNTADYQCLFADGAGKFDVYIRPDKKIHVWTGSQQSFYGIPDIQTGDWVNLILVKDGSNASLYYNGVLAQTISFSGSSFSITNGFVGIGLNSLYDFNGEMAGFKIFNTALTAAQVADLYNNPEKVVPTGVDNTALKLWLPMMEGAGTTAYDGSGNGNHGTISGATYVNGIGAPSPQSAVMDWNKGSNLTPYSEDFSAYSKSGVTITSNQLTSPNGLLTGSKGLETTANAYRDVIGKTFSPTASNSYTLSAFVKAGLGRDGVYLYTNDGSGNGRCAKFNLATGAYIGNAGAGGWTAFDSYGIEVAPNGWYRIHATLNSSLGSSRVFNVGLSDNTNDALGPYVGDATKGLYVWGYQFQQTAAVGPYIPTLATIQTSDVLLPQGLTTGRDITGVNLFENVRKQGALNLDGKSWAEVHDNASVDLTDAITLEAWVYWDGSSGKGIFGRWHSNASNRNYLLYKNSSTTINLYINSSAIASYASLNATKGWTHIVGTYNRTNAVLYIDGVQQAITAHTTAISTGTLPVEIGRNFTTSNQALTAPIAQPRIYNRALTAEEVQRNYNAGKNTYTN